ncbi:MAG: tat (twin-arginine translocation) pathway signal sequence, partial [candidate division WOR-3 bacterium]
MNRRDFLKHIFSLTAVAGISSIVKSNPLLAAEKESNINKTPDLVAVKNGTPEKMFDKGIETLGGMKNFVKKGQTVV